MAEGEQVSVAFRIPKNLWDGAKEAAELRGMSFSAFMRMCMMNELVESRMLDLRHDYWRCCFACGGGFGRKRAHRNGLLSGHEYLHGRFEDPEGETLMSCFYCKGTMRDGMTVFTVQLDSCLVVIKNVPCLECSQCGEVEISDATMQQLERIIATCQSLIQEVAIIDYEHAA